MCTFLTVGVDRRNAVALHAALRAEGFEVSTEVNPKVAAFFEPTHALVMVTFGGCSCELTPSCPNPERDARVQRSRLRKWRKRGYSEARIARILSEIPPTSMRANTRHDRLIATARTVAPVRMCFHWVRGDPRTEQGDGNVELTVVLA